MKWLEVTLPFAETEKDIMLLDLLDLGIQGVWEENSSYKFYLPENTDLESLQAKFSSHTLNYKLVQDEDWAETWKKFWHANKIARWVIVPSWETYKKNPDELIINLDPGMAFGTGAHETTALMLELLSDKKPQVVWDIGTGTGILAIAAAQLGAEVYAFDIDPLATDATKENATKNQVIEKIEVIEGNLLEAASLFPTELPDVVLTNILAEVIVEFVPILKAKIPHFTWLLSGIIQEKAYLVEEALTKSGFKIIKRITKGEWVSMEAVI